MMLPSTLLTNDSPWRKILITHSLCYKNYTAAGEVVCIIREAWLTVIILKQITGVQVNIICY